MGRERTSMKRDPKNPDKWLVTSPQYGYGWKDQRTMSKVRAREIKDARVRVRAKRQRRARR